MTRLDQFPIHLIGITFTVCNLVFSHTSGEIVFDSDYLCCVYY